MTKFQTKLGHTRAGERTRIWLEGQRLVDAGFKPGMKFLKVWKNKQVTLTACSVAEFERSERKSCGTVSGKNGKPVIDITGAMVQQTFGTEEYVSVFYLPNRIVVKPV